MTPRGSILAVAGSLLAHAATLGTLAYSLIPAPAPDQPVPRTRMTIASQQVRQTTAPQSDNAGQPAAEGTAPAPIARQGTVRQHAAVPAPLTAAQLSAADPASPVTQALAGIGRPLAQTPAVVVAAQPDTATGIPLPALDPVAADAPALPPPAPMQQSRPPATATLPATKTDAALAVALSADAAPALQPDLPTRAAPDKRLPAIAQTASLAWSGDDGTAIGATSLAAIAAFSQQGDLSAESEQVRDGIAGILSAVPCARLQTTFNPDTGDLELTGHIPEDSLRGPVLAALRTQVGDAIPLSDNLLILPRPQCGALAGIADAGLPQSTEQLTNPRVIGADGFAQNYTYSDGQPLQLDLAGPDYDSFVYVDYFVADGSVIHLQPNDVVPLERLKAKAPMSVGRDRGDKPYLLLTVGAPFGQEIAAAFATSAPLYDDLRPVQEPAAPYLAFLKERVAAARARDPDFKGEWVYFFITTQAE